MYEAGRIQLNSRKPWLSKEKPKGQLSAVRTKRVNAGKKRNWFLRVRACAPVHKACIINTVFASLRLRVFHATGHA